MLRLRSIVFSALCIVPLACTGGPAKKPADAENAKSAKSEKDTKKAKKKDAKKGKKKDAKKSLGPIPDGPVALVSGEPISREKFMELYKLKARKYEENGRTMPASADRRYRKMLTERLIYQEVLRREAKELDVSYDEKKLEEQIASEKKSAKDWDKRLRRRGDTEETLKEQKVAALLEEALLNKRGDLTISDEEVAAEYEKLKPTYSDEKPRVRASHIMISVGPKGPAGAKEKAEASEEQKKTWEAEAEARAKDIHKKVSAKGADFGELAKELSDGPSGPRGGDLGIFNASRMVKEFSDATFKLKKGQVSKPVRSKFGFHVIKVFETFKKGTLPLDAVTDQIQSRLETRKLHEGKRELKKELLDKHKIENKMEATLGPDPAKIRREERAKRRAERASARKEKKATEKPGDAKKPAEKTEGKKADVKVEGKKTEEKKTEEKKTEEKKAEGK